MPILLNLHRKTTADKFLESIPKPEPYLPENPFPGWENIPLNTKLPNLKCPTRTMVFSRNELGRSIFSKPNARFDAVEDNIREEYNPLHDVNLRKYFMRPNNLKLLRNTGVLTEDNRVKCSWKDFNRYREYLHRLYMNNVSHQSRHLNQYSEGSRANLKRISYHGERSRIRSLRIEEMRGKIEKPVNSQPDEDAPKNVEKVREQEERTQRNLLKSKLMKEKLATLTLIDERNRNRLRNKLKQTEEVHLERIKLRKEQQLLENREKKAISWCKRIKYRQQEEIINQKLLKDADEQLKLNIEKRSRRISAIRENDQYQILMNKSNIIRQHYESRTIDELMKAIILEVNRIVAEQTEQQRKGQPKRFHRRRTPSISNFRMEPPLTGYATLTLTDIERVVKAAINFEVSVNKGFYTTCRIIEATKKILDRIARGPMFDLPRDHAVQEFIKKKINENIQEIERSVIKEIKRMTVKAQTKKFQKKRAVTVILDTIQSECPSSSNSHIIKSMKQEKSTPGLRSMVRSIFRMENDPKEFHVPDHFHDDTLFHLYPNQKTFLAAHFRGIFGIVSWKVEQLALNRIDIQALTTQPSQSSPIDFRQLLESMTISCLTPPERDEFLTKNLNDLCNYVTDNVIAEISEFFVGESKVANEEL